jgi:hypothetical protein
MNNILSLNNITANLVTNTVAPISGQTSQLSTNQQSSHGFGPAFEINISPAAYATLPNNGGQNANGSNNPVSVINSDPALRFVGVWTSNDPIVPPDPIPQFVGVSVSNDPVVAPQNLSGPFRALQSNPFSNTVANDPINNSGVGIPSDPTTPPHIAITAGEFLPSIPGDVSVSNDPNAPSSPVTSVPDGNNNPVSVINSDPILQTVAVAISKDPVSSPASQLLVSVETPSEPIPSIPISSGNSESNGSTSGSDLLKQFGANPSNLKLQTSAFALNQIQQQIEAEFLTQSRTEVTALIAKALTS